MKGCASFIRGVFMKKTVLWFLKAGAAALIAFVILSVFSYFYYNLPIHYSDPSGVTDYVWDRNAFCSRGTEGFSWLKTDDNGYVNTYPNKKEQVDILVMGSSHSEGFNVNYDENYTYVLNELLEEKGKGLYAYSVATSGHGLERNINNLSAALERFQPSKYVVIEFPDLELDPEGLKEMVEGRLEPMPSYNSGLIFQLQKSDLLRLMYYQLSQVSINKAVEAELLEEKPDEQLYEFYYDYYMNQMLAMAAETAREHDCELIITYLSLLEFDYNGRLVEPMDAARREQFRGMCEKNGIVYLDMYSAYAEMYNTTNRLPRGYSNTVAGEGHTNKYGHACIARELYQLITKEDFA